MILLNNGHKISAVLIPHPVQRHRQTPFSQIKYQPAPKREHQLFSSREIFWRNFWTENQKVNASYVVLCLSVYTLIVL
jgi:hypothetical protein